MVLGGSLLLALSSGCPGDDATCPAGLVPAGTRCVLIEDAGPCPGVEETCNVIDDDCDGEIDEGLVQACGVSMVGACTMGTEMCLLGEFEDCTAVLPGEEVCGDGIDGDCDGSTDEDCPCDPGATQACGSDVGACSPGTQTCGSDERFGPCEGAVEPTAETCNGVDDDCNGMVDDPTAACGTSMVGLCCMGVQACVDGELICMGGVEPVDETCDGMDNDCDGSVDEEVVPEWRPDVDGDGFGDSSVAGVSGCEAPDDITNPVDNADDCDDGCAACFDGATEICDGLNNDCDADAALDEGIGSCVFGEEVACTTTCGSMGLGACDAMCEPPDDTDDCTPPEETCNFRDDDCDGFEDEATRRLTGAGTLSTTFTDGDDVRLFPTTHGFVAFVKVGRDIFGQRLTDGGTPVGPSRRVNSTANINAWDAAAIDDTDIVLAWVTSGGDLISKVVRDNGSTPASVTLEQTVDGAADQFGAVAVSATADDFVFAYGLDGPRTLRIARASHSYASVRTLNVSEVTLGLGTRADLEFLATDVSGGSVENDHTLAWYDGDDLYVGTVGVGSTGSRQPFLLTRNLVGTCLHPVLATSGGREGRVLGCMNGTEFMIWNLNDDSELVGTAVRITEMVSTTRASRVTHDLVFAGGRWILAGETESATAVGLRELEPNFRALARTSLTSPAYDAARVAADSAGRIVGIVSRDGTTTTWTYDCP